MSVYLYASICRNIPNHHNRVIARDFLSEFVLLIFLREKFFFITNIYTTIHITIQLLVKNIHQSIPTSPIQSLSRGAVILHRMVVTNIYLAHLSLKIDCIGVRNHELFFELHKKYVPIKIPSTHIYPYRFRDSLLMINVVTIRKGIVKAVRGPTIESSPYFTAFNAEIFAIAPRREEIASIRIKLSDRFGNQIYTTTGIRTKNEKNLAPTTRLYSSIELFFLASVNIFPASSQKAFKKATAIDK